MMTCGFDIDTSCQNVNELCINTPPTILYFVLLGAALFMFKLIIRFTAQRGIPVGEVV